MAQDLTASDLIPGNLYEALDVLDHGIGIKPDGSALMVVGPGEKILSPRPPPPRITPLQLLWMHLELDGRLLSNFG